MARTRPTAARSASTSLTKTELSAHGPGAIAAVVAVLNARPRETLGWETPAEALDQWQAASKKGLLRRPLEFAPAGAIEVMGKLCGITG